MKSGYGKKVVAIVVTYNRSELLEECVYSLLNQTIVDNLDIIIVNNASTDNTEEIVRNKFLDYSNVIYYNTGSNLGGAGGFEYGVIKAMDIESDYLWLMDDDCIPEKDAAAQLVSAGEKIGQFGFLSSYTKWIDGSICTMNVQRRNIAKKLKVIKKDMTKIQIATFVSFFVPTTVVKEVGAPIGDFFIWGDDWEYSRRISLKYPCYLVKKSVVVHKTKHNNGCDISSDDVARISRYGYTFRNEMYIMKREGIFGWVYYVLKVIKNLLKTIFTKNDMKMERIKVILKSVATGLKFRPRVKLVANK